MIYQNSVNDKTNVLYGNVFKYHIKPHYSQKRFTIDALTAEVKDVEDSVSKLDKNLKNCPADVKNQLKSFLQVSFHLYILSKNFFDKNYQP